MITVEDVVAGSSYFQGWMQAANPFSKGNEGKLEGMLSSVTMATSLRALLCGR